MSTPTVMPPANGAASALLVLDAGNTNLRLAWWVNGTARARFDAPVSQVLETGYDVAAAAAWAARLALPERRMLVASLVQKRWEPACRALADRLGAQLHLLTAASPLPFAIRYREGSRPGADRLARAVALRARGIRPAAAVAFGTATTIDVIDAEGDFAGGAILPGARVAMEALFARTSGLLEVPELRAPDRAVGASTDECLRAGGVLGHVGAVDRLLEEMARELSVEALPVVATGGLAPALITLSRHPMALEPDFTLEGLALWAESAGIAG